MQPGDASTPIHECGVLERPCPRTGCRYYLEAPVLEATRRGPPRRHLLVVDASDSCALDVAERGKSTLEAIGRRLGVSRQRVEQIEGRALRKVHEVLERRHG